MFPLKAIYVLCAIHQVCNDIEAFLYLFQKSEKDLTHGAKADHSFALVYVGTDNLILLVKHNIPFNHFCSERFGRPP